MKKIKKFDMESLTYWLKKTKYSPKFQASGIKYKKGDIFRKNLEEIYILSSWLPSLTFACRQIFSFNFLLS